MISSLFIELILASVDSSGSLTKVPSAQDWQLLYNLAEKQALCKYANAVGQLSDANERVWSCRVLDKNPERCLCYVLKLIDSTLEDKCYALLPEFWEDEEQ